MWHRQWHRPQCRRRVATRGGFTRAILSACQSVAWGRMRRGDTTLGWRFTAQIPSTLAPSRDLWRSAFRLGASSSPLLSRRLVCEGTPVDRGPPQEVFAFSCGHRCIPGLVMSHDQREKGMLHQHQLHCRRALGRRSRRSRRSSHTLVPSRSGQGSAITLGFALLHGLIYGRRLGLLITQIAVSAWC